jgi:hypothetical protein
MPEKESEFLTLDSTELGDFMQSDEGKSIK